MQPPWSLREGGARRCTPSPGSAGLHGAKALPLHPVHLQGCPARAFGTCIPQHPRGNWGPSPLQPSMAQCWHCYTHTHTDTLTHTQPGACSLPGHPGTGPGTCWQTPLMQGGSRHLGTQRERGRGRSGAAAPVRHHCNTKTRLRLGNLPQFPPAPRPLSTSRVTAKETT